MNKFISVLLCLFIFTTTSFAQWGEGYDGGSMPAQRIFVDTDEFDVNLSDLDDNVQKALETLDEPHTSGGGWVDDGTVVRLDNSTDNVGVGTSSPTQKLHVDGNFRIGNRSIRSASSTQTITAAGGVTVTHSIMRLVSDGGEVNITVNPQISGCIEDGEELTLIGGSDINSLVFEDGNGLSMGSQITLGDEDTIDFLCNLSKSLWVMNGSDTK